MNNLLKKMDIKKVWVYIFLLFFVIIILLNIPNTFYIALVLLVVLGLFINKLKIKKYWLFIIIFSFLIRLLIILFIKTPLESDFSILLNASNNILNNDYSFMNTLYFKTWSYQLGFAFIQSLFLRIFNDILFLKIINCIISSFTVLLIYLIAKEFVKEKSAQLVSLIYSVLPFTLTYVTILSNQFLSTFLIYLSFYIIISSKFKLNEKLRYIIAGTLLAFANVIRPESIVALVSIILFLILTMIIKRNYKEKLINITLVTVCYYAVFMFISFMFVISNISEDGLKNNDPYWKFLLGFNHTTNGTYDYNDVQYLNNSDKELEIIKERVFTSPTKLVKLFSNKINIFWNDSDLSWTFGYISNNSVTVGNKEIYVSDITNKLESVNTYLLIILYICVFIGIYLYINKKKYNENIILLINNVFVTFGVFLLIEVQTRYAYNVQVSIAIISALGINEIYNKIKMKKLEVKNEKTI